MVVYFNYKQSTSSCEERSDYTCLANTTNSHPITASTSQANDSNINCSSQHESHEKTEKCNGEKYLIDTQSSCCGPQSNKFTSSTLVNTSVIGGSAMSTIQSMPLASETDQQKCQNAAHLLPKAVLLCRPNSHPFQERKFVVENQVKIGRAVARSKPNVDNAIFDCKVLSRNHALLWYENGKFLLQDTRSSNGTFVNNQRLSPANEESSPKELSSGDVVQFGVDVVENTKKVTHGCIIATINLYHPDGSEAKLSQDSIFGSNGHFSITSVGNPMTTFSSQNMHLLAQYLKEALHREELLKSKLSTLETVVSATQETSESSWKSMVEEDRLISKIESLQHRLESLLNANSGSDSDEKVTLLKNEMMKVHEEKEKFEIAAKEAIQKSLEEKLSAFSKIYELESTLKTTDEECKRLKEVCSSLENEIAVLTEIQDKQTKELGEAHCKAKETEEKVIVLTENLKQEKNKLDNKLTEFQLKETQLQQMVDSLKEKNESDFLQIELLKQQLEVAKREMHSKDQSKDLFNDPTGYTVNCNASPEKSTVKPKLEQQLVNSASIVESESSVVKDENGTALTNGEVNIENHQKSSSQTSNVDNSDVNETSQLLSDIESLKKLLVEARSAKKKLEERVANLEKQIEELFKSKEELRNEAKCNETKLNATKYELDLKTKCYEATLRRVSVLEQQLKYMQNHDLLSNQSVDLKKTSNQQQQQQQQCNINRIQNSKIKSEVQSVLGNTELSSKLTEAQESTKQNQFDASIKQKHNQETGAAINKKRSVNDAATCNAKEKWLSECSPEKDHKESEINEDQKDSEKQQTTNVIPEEKDVVYWKHRHQIAVREMKENRSKLEKVELEMQCLREERDKSLMLHKSLTEELKSIKEDFELISYQNKTASACAILPLLVLLLALVFAYYPSISVITGTIES